MTFRELQKYIGRMTADQLDNTIVIESNDSFYRVEGLNEASGEGDYLYKGEMYFSLEDQAIEEKEFDEEETEE
jgi:hypothetical protein